MKRKGCKIVLPAVLCAALLAGCARGAAAPDPAAVPPSETETPAATAAPQPTAQPTMAPEPSPKPAETAVYAPGAVMLKDEGLFETPPGLDADEFHTFAYYLTIALPDPVETIGEADSKAAFRLSRCMLDCFYGIYPDACSEVVYLEQDGMIRNYNVIPAGDFVAFTAARLGIGDLAFFESAIPAEDMVVRFEADAGRILLVPAMEYLESDFDSAHVEVESEELRLIAETEDGGERMYVFDIAQGIDQYRLLRVV